MDKGRVRMEIQGKGEGMEKKVTDLILIPILILLIKLI
jgi:hypothetical protein